MQALHLRVWAASTGSWLPPPMRRAVGEADCGWAGGRPMRSCYYLAESLCIGFIAIHRIVSAHFLLVSKLLAF